MVVEAAQQSSWEFEMFLVSGIQNPLDPTGQTFDNAVVVPYEFTVRNIERKISVKAYIYASIEALAANAPPVRKTEFSINDHQYYDMMAKNEESFIGLAQVIDSYLTEQFQPHNPQQIPITLPVEPEASLVRRAYNAAVVTLTESNITDPAVYQALADASTVAEIEAIVNEATRSDV